MDKKNNKTLYVFVFDTIKVSDKRKKKVFENNLVVKPSLSVFTDFFIQSMFAGVKLFARPPTSQLNFGNFSRNHLAY